MTSTNRTTHHRDHLVEEPETLEMPEPLEEAGAKTMVEMELTEETVAMVDAMEGIEAIVATKETNAI